MVDNKEAMNKSLDPAVQQMIAKAEARNVTTVWDRYAAMTAPVRLRRYRALLPPLPARALPHRSLRGRAERGHLRRHGRYHGGPRPGPGHRRRNRGPLRTRQAPGPYPDEDGHGQGPGLFHQGARQSCEPWPPAWVSPSRAGRISEIALDVADAALADFHEKDTPVLWAATVVNPERAKVLTRPRTWCPRASTMRSPKSCTAPSTAWTPTRSICCWAACAAPWPIWPAATWAPIWPTSSSAFPNRRSRQANLGTLKADAVNIALHGHNPVLSDIWSGPIAGQRGWRPRRPAPRGINLVGICCTGNEVMMRHGIPACTHSVSQEMAIVTGALDAMVVDYQCIMPSVVTSPSAPTPAHHHHGHRQDPRRHPCRFTEEDGRRQGRGDHRHGHRRLQTPQEQAGRYPGLKTPGRGRLFRRGHRRGARQSWTPKTP